MNLATAFVLLLAAAPSAKPADDHRPTVLVHGVEAPALPPDAQRELNAVLVSSVEKLSRFKVFRAKNAALPEPGRKPSKPGEPCETTAPCLEDSAVAEVDKSVFASAGQVGAGWILKVRVMDEKTLKLDAKLSVEVASPAGLAAALREAVTKVFATPAPAKP